MKRGSGTVESPECVIIGTFIEINFEIGYLLVFLQADSGVVERF
jgi:hypothetical protein